MKREIDLLNSIDNSKHLTSKDSYKASFVENLDDILSGIDDSLDRIAGKKREVQQKKDQLSDEYALLLEKERLYHKTLDDFKNECQLNEELRKEG
ncbi:hypothetical protein L596_009505 [Steinernema carpocapsae]|uniref:Coiled-coil domain-containing protein 93 n=1 Tax=Steinernema carpocapsae TaxID=34508 RepID=A0A4U5PFJ4_STECR|nr:hypothetical protein L596_009505 [Steinernema carpocapsae]